MKCSLTASLFSTAPTQANKNSWCQRQSRTKGDSDGDGVVTFIEDYANYLQVVVGNTLPPNVNPDVNGDGIVSPEDRTIIIQNLQ